MTVTRTYAGLRAENEDQAARQADADKQQRIIDALHARVFGTPEGQQLLAYLRSITIESRNNSLDSDGALREAEARRNFVSNMERRIARHLAPTPKKKSG